ncbi:hypothetical protein HK099_003823, partial [Clydaea vesicula]
MFSNYHQEQKKNSYNYGESPTSHLEDLITQNDIFFMDEDILFHNKLSPVESTNLSLDLNDNMDLDFIKKETDVTLTQQQFHQQQHQLPFHQQFSFANTANDFTYNNPTALSLNNADIFSNIYLHENNFISPFYSLQNNHNQSSFLNNPQNLPQEQQQHYNQQSLASISSSAPINIPNISQQHLRRQQDQNVLNLSISPQFGQSVTAASSPTTLDPNHLHSNNYYNPSPMLSPTSLSPISLINPSNSSSTNFSPPESNLATFASNSAASSTTSTKTLKQSQSFDASTFACVCGKRYASLNALKNHAKLHTVRERNFICSHCKKAFLRKQDLKRHETTHLEDYHPYSCDNCGTTFTRSDALSRHIKARR